MTKKLSIFLVAVLTVASLAAQPVERSGSALFAPRAGQWQINLMLGRGLFFPIENSNYLLPSIAASDNIGLAHQQLGLADGQTLNQSGDPAIIFHIGSLNNNSITNIAGIQGKYFVTNRIEVNAIFTMDIGVQPQRHFLDGIDYGDPDTQLAGIKYVQGRLSNEWMAAIGSNYYLNNCNGRIFPYIGVLGGFQHARIQATLPYTGDENGNIWTELYYVQARAGEVFGITGAITAGIEYNLLPGLNMAFEVRPFNYMYTLGRMYSEGLAWNANTHNVKFFALPQLKLGIRF